MRWVSFTIKLHLVKGIELLSKFALLGLTLLIVNRRKWLGRPVNIKEANKQAKIYLRRPLTLHIVCFMLTMHELHNRNGG